MSNERLAIRFADYLYKTKSGWEFHHILDTPFFVNSKVTPGIQIADLFAYVINQRFQKRGGKLIKKYYTEKKMQFEWESEEEEDYVVRGIKFIEREEETPKKEEGTGSQ